MFHTYIRHFARQRESVVSLLDGLRTTLPEGATCKVCLTGSGARTLAEELRMPFTQEVVANSIALKKQYAKLGTAIELGGQDAKIIFFREDAHGEPAVFDMRMNGSCAGGTGAFIDEVSVILGVEPQDMNGLACKGTRLYDISGRCGVFAKTDIQPLLNQGARTEDLALSCYHAIAKQTIGGLAQGIEIRPPVVFEGGPLTFHPQLVEVFRQRLQLSEADVLLPAFPEIMVAYGAALSIDALHTDAQAYRLDDLIARFQAYCGADDLRDSAGPRYFADEQEEREFRASHALAPLPDYQPRRGEVVEAYLGMDAGSTTTKLALLDREGTLLDAYYASNRGDPLRVAQRALLKLYEKYERAGAELRILAAASTGYGEYLFSKGFRTETHIVETVAHAMAAAKYVARPSFILDIGGQDMKAIWLEDGVITNIVVNEACSSGCGSFLENFAKNLHIPTEQIADRAFSAQNPARLGSRCTVFMNSSIITEQRNGKQPDDIMAGLCRSIIENVFTKVIRVSNLDSLGDRIVVQGGTFQNDAVLRAMEQYVGRPVIRAPYAGLMGAIGAAMAAQECAAGPEFHATFLSREALRAFSYTQTSNAPCPHCANHCNRTILTFSTGDHMVTNNRCERGEILDAPGDAEPGRELRREAETKRRPANLFSIRERLLFQEYPCPQLRERQNVRIGIPRVLSFWDDMPFWSTFWRALGYDVVLSPASTRQMYEDGLQAVPSDTECFPAKLVHGHLRRLAEMGVDRIFFPILAVTPSENREKTSVSRCALVKGYPIVLRNSDNPETNWEIPFDTPYFYWYTDKDRERQLSTYMEETFGIAPSVTEKAISAGMAAQEQFRSALREKGREVLEQAAKEDRYAVVIAGRPYHNDPLIHHGIPQLLTSMGVPVLTADSLPDAESVDLSKSRLDIVNNFHARILSSSILAAQQENLEMIQIVSFGCGHDACLTDEAIRLMKEIGNKAPLILKVDESDAIGPLRIRIRSFIETIERKRRLERRQAPRQAQDPYAVKFQKRDVQERVVLVPNASHAFSQVLSAALHNQHIRAVSLDLGREEAIRLGKQYTHNDICFPAQIVVGEALDALRSGAYDPDHVAIAMAKYIGCCRLTHYAAILRKALDDAGFPQVPILTNDDVDAHDLHPGYRMNLASSLKIVAALPMIDTFEELLRKIRPYEKIAGSADAAFTEAMDLFCAGLERGFSGAIQGFKQGLKKFAEVDFDRRNPRPTVLIVGEYLLNFHAGANREVERYLEKEGFECISAKMSDVIQKTYFCQDSQIRERGAHRDPHTRLWTRMADLFFTLSKRICDRAAKSVPLHEPVPLIEELAQESDDLMHHTFDTGEGILIPAEILHHAKKGCRNFVILQPFGCLPNHVVGRGMTKKLKEMFPDIELLPLDYDPDVSFANLENRLQMLVMQQK